MGDEDEIEKDGVLIALNSFNGDEKIYAVNFYPKWYVAIPIHLRLFRLIFPFSDSFNSSVRKLFMNRIDHDCYISIYAMCQEGMTLIKAMDVDLNKGKLVYCGVSRFLLLPCLSPFP